MKRDMSNKITYTSHRINRLLSIEGPQECRSSLPGNCEFAAGKLTVPSGGTISLLPVGSKSTCSQPSVSTSQSVRHFVRFVLLVFLLLMAGVTGAWGQIADGYYFIANNNGYSATTPANNWYLVPAKDPQQPHYADAYFNSQYCNISGKGDYTGENYGDPEKPFLTSYKTNQDDNSIWQLVSTGDGSYYIIHAVTGKYVVYEPPYKDATNRKSMHLQTFDSSPTDNAKFVITRSGSNPNYTYSFRPKSVSDGNRFFNPAGGNVNQYYSSGGDYFHLGMVGLYSNASDGNSFTRMEIADCATPVITFSDEVDKIKITSGTEGAQIYYTTDGSDPESSETRILYTTDFDLTSDVTIIRACAQKAYHNTTSASFTISVRVGSTHPYLIQSVDNNAFYMIPGELDNNGNTTVNTTSLARPSMSWYFLNAGNVNGTQYYYVFNRETGDYLQRSGDNLFLRDASTFEAASDKTDYCFSIAEAASGYNIIARGLPNNAIYKGGNNNSPRNNQTNNIGSNGAKTNKYSCWNFVSFPGNTMPTELRPEPFNVSTGAATNYYKIENANATKNYIIPPTGTSAYASTSASAADDIDNWYFLEAGTDDWLTYYYIVNAISGEYLYYQGEVSTATQTNAFVTKPLGDGIANNYKFAVAKTTTEGQYYIVPEPLKYLSNNQYCLVWRDGGNALKTNLHRDNAQRKWTFTPSTLVIAPPIINFDAANEKITFETTTKQGTISFYYTTDGTDPTTSSTAYNASTGIQVGSGAFTYGPSDLVLKAIAVLDDGTTQTLSAVTTQTIDLTLNRPTVSVEGLNATFSNGQTGVEFLYTTDGSDPKTGGIQGTSLTLTDGALNTIRVVTHTNVSGTDYYSSVIVTEIIDLTEQGTDLSGITYLQSNQTKSQYLYPNTTTTASGDLYVKSNTIKDEAAVWQLEKNGYYYYIRHYADGALADRRYLTAIPTATNNAFFLSATASDDAQFEVTETTAGSGIYLIKAKNASNSDNKYYLRNNGNNNAQLAASTDNNAKWLLSKVPAAPTISVDDIRVTLASDLGTIRYTVDGSEPTTASAAYNGVIQLHYGPAYTIRTVSHYRDKEDTERLSDVAHKAVKVDLEAPTIDILGTTVTIYSSQTKKYPESVIIRYTMSGPGETEPTDPTPTTGTRYTGSFELATAGTYVIKAIIYTIVPEGEFGEGTYQTAVIRASSSVQPATEISDLAGLEAIASNLSGSYILTADIDASSLTALGTFTGTFDGGFHKISGLSHALFSTVNGGTIKNVVLDEVSIGSGTNVGAICNEADGAARIYNCGILRGEVSGSDNVGGLVGLIKSGSEVRVVNCYSYAKVSGGTTKAGIVGKNEGSVGQVRIANCMMYGDMPSGTSPVYAGNHTSNVQNFTEYNFYRSKANLAYDTYNDQLAIDKDEYLTRFPFYRHIQNTHRELAGYFLFDNYLHTDEIGHWVLNTAVAPYPIIEKWESNTKKVLDAPAGPLVADEKLGTSLAITVKIGNNEYAGYSLPITDMDEANYDYTYGKVVLPFANEFEVNTDYSKICTGWKITNIAGGNGATFENHNYANRDCTAKDLYDNSKFIFAQGGYFIVPYNVTAITIEANFADAFYLSDATYEVGYKSNYTVPTGLGGDVPTTFHGQTVYFNIVDALAKMEDKSTPHDQAVVLVGNYHFPTEIPSGKDANPLSGYTSKAFTLMSIDEDNNQEPDYGWYSNNSLDRPAIAPVRFDFIPLISLGMSAHVSGSTGYPGIPIWKPRGWFEMTETSLCIMNQFELDSGNFVDAAGNINNRSIINGGYFVQMIRANKTKCNKVNYIQVGGNAYIKEFYPGNHSTTTNEVPLVPINVTGGEIEQCFMTGYGKGSAAGSDIRFWCAGGKIHKFLGAYMENPKTAGVNMTAKIDHALIGRFYGGGTSASATIKGNIDVTIDNSKVDFYCGGPEFGDMTSGKTVTTRATNTVFGEYYGAGFGGTSISYSNDKNEEITIGNGTTTDYPDYFTTHYLGAEEGRLKQKNGGIGTCYKFEYIVHSYKQATVARFYTGYAQFSLATTGNVTNILNKCKFKKLAASATVLGEEPTSGDFYGAGCQGKVDGTVESTLTGCTVEGSAYGGGYKAESNELDVYPETKPGLSKYYRETGLFSDFDFSEVIPGTYTWTQGDASNKNTVVNGKTQIYTDVVMSDLGNVTGAISLTIDGDSTIGTEGDSKTGNVFGGGNESKSLNNTTVKLKGNTRVLGSVFGGGNEAEVGGSTYVTIGETTGN